MRGLSPILATTERHQLRSIERDGLPLYFLHAPSQDQAAPIVVFSHGFPGNAYDWLGQFEVCLGRYEIVAPFMPGTCDGRVAPKSRLSTQSLMEDAAAVLHEVDPSENRPLFFVGHDLGCFLNTDLAWHYGERVRGVVNINGLGLQQYYFRLFGLSQWLKSYYVLLLQFALVRRLVADLMPGVFLRLIYRMSGVNSDDALFKHDKRVFSSIYIYRTLLKRTRRYVRCQVHKISTPTTFIWGNKDAFLNIPSRSEVDRFHERGEVRVLRGGHWVNRSNKDHVNRLLQNLLARWDVCDGGSVSPELKAVPATWNKV